MDRHFFRDGHTPGVSLCMVSTANPAGQLLLVPLTAGNQGAKIPSGSSQLERGAGGEEPSPDSDYSSSTLCTPGLGWDGGDTHSSQQGADPGADPATKEGHMKSLDLEAGGSWCPLHPWHHRVIPSHPPRARRQRPQQNGSCCEKAKLSPLKIAQWNFPLKEGKTKKRGEKNKNPDPC